MIKSIVKQPWSIQTTMNSKCLGPWVTMTFMGMVGRTISYLKFDPPMKFVVEKADVVGHVPNSIPRTYQHGEVNFQFSYEKNCLPMMLLLDFL